jgi:hypothetical protein
VLAAESFNRGFHCDGLIDWLGDTDTPLEETTRSVRLVGAPNTAEILEHVAAKLPPGFGVAALFAQESLEDLSTLIADCVRRDLSRFPALRESSPVGVSNEQGSPGVRR